MLALPSLPATTESNSEGDCILTGDGDDLLRGGRGSDHLGAGAGTDLVDGSDGNDLLLGDAGTDVILGGPHDDVLVGGEDDDHLLGGAGDDRLRGNEGDDDLIGGRDSAGLVDGQDVLLGGRGQDVLAAENAVLVSASIVTAIDLAAWTVGDVPTFVPAPVLATVDSDVRFDDSALTCGDGGETRWLELLTGGGETRTPLASPGGPVVYDELFGGFGCDWVFGQEGDDLVRGGQDDDVVEAGPGVDVAYGDAADVGAAGPQTQSDHVIDWIGAHNVFYVCEGAYGAGRVIRQGSPDLVGLLTDLVMAAGGVEVSTGGSAAWTDLGLVGNSDRNQNNTPSPEWPGNFTCEGQ